MGPLIDASTTSQRIQGEYDFYFKTFTALPS